MWHSTSAFEQFLNAPAYVGVETAKFDSDEITFSQGYYRLTRNADRSKLGLKGLQVLAEPEFTVKPKYDENDIAVSYTVTRKTI